MKSFKLKKLLVGIFTLAALSGLGQKDSLAQQFDKSGDNNDKRDLTESVLNTLSPMSISSNKTQFLSLLEQRDQKVSKIEKDSVDRQNVLETRKKDHDKELDKRFGALVGMLDAGDAVDIDPDRREDIYNTERTRIQESDGRASRDLFTGMRDLGLETQKEKAKANEKFFQEVSNLSGNPQVQTLQNLQKAPGNLN